MIQKTQPASYSETTNSRNRSLIDTDSTGLASLRSRATTTMTNFLLFAAVVGCTQALLAPRQPQLRSRTRLRLATQSLLERDITRLADRSKSWAASKPEERVAVAEACLACLREEPWDAGWLQAQTDLEATSASRSRYVFGAVVGDWLETFIDAQNPASETRHAFEHGERVPLGLSVPGATAEIIQGDHKATEARAAEGTVSLVLGAGNQSFLALIDVLQRALINKECVMLKHHPLRPWLVKPYAAILEPLIELDVVAQTLDEGVDAAAALVAHRLIGHVHLTGGEATRDAVRRTLDAAGKTDVAISSELGCVTPWLVAGGAWTAKELTRAARNVVAAKKANGGSNCLSPQVLVVSKEWPQREAFLGGFQAALETPNRVTYLEETMRAIEAGELTLSSRSLAQERGQKALEKRVAGLTSLLVASTLLNIAMPMVVGPLRKLTFVAAAFFGTKALPALL